MKEPRIDAPHEEWVAYREWYQEEYRKRKEIDDRLIRTDNEGAISVLYNADGTKGMRLGRAAKLLMTDWWKHMSKTAIRSRLEKLDGFVGYDRLVLRVEKRRGYRQPDQVWLWVDDINDVI